VERGSVVGHEDAYGPVLHGVVHQREYPSRFPRWIPPSG
jgi:hypothetical protein